MAVLNCASENGLSFDVRGREWLTFTLSSAMRKSIPLLIPDLAMNARDSLSRTSNNNAYSEAHFKTVEHHPRYSLRFDILLAARVWEWHFFPLYDFEHYHLGLGHMTRESVRYGWTPLMHEQRGYALGRVTRPIPNAVRGAQCR